MGDKGIVFGAKNREWKGLIRTTEIKPFGHLDIVGQCAREHVKMLMDSAEDYNLRFPEYLHWVIANPRGEAYGYYLVREKRL